MNELYNLFNNFIAVTNSCSKNDVTDLNSMLYDDHFSYTKLAAIANSLGLRLDIMKDISQIQYKQWQVAPLFSIGQGIVLIGGSGAGKTTLASHLARLLSLPFIDSDELIQTERKETIANIFLRYGELGFRAIEAHFIHQCVALPSVVSIGAGAWENAETRKMIREANFATLWLAESPDKAWSRVKDDSMRPLVTTYDRFLIRWIARIPAWSEATAVIPTQESSAHLAKALVQSIEH